MGEHLPCKQGVKSSNLSISMKIAKSAAAAGRHRHPMDACVQSDGYGGRGMDDRRASMSEQSDFLCERSVANLTILLRTLKTAYRKQYLIDQISKTSEGNHRKVISNKVKVNNPPICVTLYTSWLSEEERRVDALALRADERRDKLRKAAERSTYPLTRRSLNGETHMSEPHVSVRQSITYGGEPGELKHLSSRRKGKKNRYRK